MAQLDKKPSVIISLIDLEKKISKLYLGYSKSFKELSGFWDEVAREEEKHAELVSELAEKFRDISIYFNENRFSESAVRDQIKIVDEHLKIQEKGGLSSKEALKTAHKIEGSILESAFYAVFSNDPEEVIKVITRIREEEKRHTDEIGELLALQEGD